jgi:hypothetical protein
MSTLYFRIPVRAVSTRGAGDQAGCHEARWRERDGIRRTEVGWIHHIEQLRRNCKVNRPLQLRVLQTRNRPGAADSVLLHLLMN